MNILTTDPKLGWKRFLKGLAVFFVGLILLLLSPPEQHEIMYFAIAILGSGFVYAMTGYLPMLIHRLSLHGLSSKRSQSVRFKSDFSDK